MPRTNDEVLKSQTGFGPLLSHMTVQMLRLARCALEFGRIQCRPSGALADTGH
jgi:hypothetical protein